MGETDSKKKGPWTREEDQKLIACVQEHGYGSWRTFPSLAGLQRCGKSCRLRWTNYLKPDIKRGKFSTHEEKTIIRLHALLGTRWSAIAAHLPKRSDKEIKNYWNTRLKKRLTRMGIDPNTHKPRAGSSRSITHTAQWEAARLQAEARLRAQFELPRPPPPPCTVLDAVVPPISNLNEYACGVGVGVGQVDCYADTQQVADGEFVLEQFNQELEDDKSYWNYLLNLVSSSPLDFY